MIQIQAGMPSASYQQHLKDQNVTLLFDLVRRRVPISRAELTKTSGLAAAFTSGDEAVTACLQRYGRDLCCAIVSLVNLLDVRAVRLGGFPYLLGEPFAELLRSILAEKFHILTSTGALNLQLFDCKYEDVRKAAVLQTLEAIFSKH